MVLVKLWEILMKPSGPKALPVVAFWVVIMKLSLGKMGITFSFRIEIKKFKMFWKVGKEGHET